MGLDKLVDSSQLDSDLTSVANAIRAKSGGSSQLAFPAGFVSEIQAIPTGSVSRTKWFRPPDWPDYDSIIDKSIFQRDPEGATLQGCNCFFTVQTNIPGKKYFRIRKFGTVTEASVGTIENGAYLKIADLSTSGNNIEFDVSDYNTHNYVCVHLVASYSARPQVLNQIANGPAHPTNGAAPVLEFYGWFDGFCLQQIPYSLCHFYSIRSVVVYGSYASTSAISGATMPPVWLEHVDLSNCGSVFLSNNFTGCKALVEFVLPNKKTIYSGLLPSMLKDCYSVSEIDLSRPTVDSLGTSISSMFERCCSLESLDMSGWNMGAITTASNAFLYCYNLKNVTLTDATLPAANLSLSESENLTKDSLVAIANALKTSAAKTLTLHATPKAACSTIMGTVADGVFAEDAGGSVTLTDFITQTKGWTLA